MIRRKSTPAPRLSGREELRIIQDILLQSHPAWAAYCRTGFEEVESAETARLLAYLARLERNTSLFIPALDPSHGITERGGDAILAYLRNADGSGSYWIFADVSGFTVLLTYLTERFGKEEAGDIMNLSILNRFCLNKMGLLLKHLRGSDSDLDRGVAALKIMLAIRASMSRITLEVREELRRKLAGKPHQDEIQRFIERLVVKASGGVVFDPDARSDYYGTAAKARITWGATGKLVAQAEKLGGNDERVSEDEEEVKGFAVDERVYGCFGALFEEGWLGFAPDDLAISRPQGPFRKVVIRPSGMSKLAETVEEICSRQEYGPDVAAVETLPVSDPMEQIAGFGGRLLEIERFLGSRNLLLHLVRNLGREGDNNLLLDENCSSVRDSGVLFCNFEIPGPEVLDSLADCVHAVMRRYGIHYKYNIFPKGDFNLMGVLGTMFAEKRESDRYFTEILWNAWRDLNRDVEKEFDSRVRLRGGLSVGKALQGPAGDNIINNEETIIGPDCNLAARLVNEALAQEADGSFRYPGGTLFTIEAHRRKVDHLVQPLPPERLAELKGFSKPVALYTLVERDRLENVPDFIARLRRIPLVTTDGKVVRETDDMRRGPFISRCMDVIDSVVRGDTDKSQLIAFIAASGVGKTRRIAEIANWCLENGWPVYFGECYSWYQGEGPGSGPETADGSRRMPEHHSDEGAYPFFPFIRILKEQVFRIDNQDTPEVKRDKIARVLCMLDPANPEMEGQAPVIGAFLGVDVPETGFSRALDAEGRRNVFYDRAADIFAREVRLLEGRGVALLCIDDLQWSDRNSLHLLSYIIRRVGPGLVVCVNARAEDQLGALLDPDLPVDRHVLEPPPLDPDAVETLARVVLGMDIEDEQAGLPPELSEKLRKELENNPFFIIEFCGKIQEQEIIRVADGCCTGFDSEEFSRVSIPTKIQGVIEERINRLSKEEHTAIQFSSVLGNILRYVIIRQYLPAVDQGSVFKDLSLDDLFHRLTGQEITRLENERDPEWVYTFKRALIGEKLYQELVPSLRKKLHWQVAAVFEKTVLSNKFEKMLMTALHYSNAEVPDKACEFYLEAGRMAGAVFDNERSLLLFDRTESILDGYRLKDAENRKRLLLEERGKVRLLLGRYEEALADFRALAALAVEAGDAGLEARALYLIGGTCLQRAAPGDFPGAVDSYEKAAAKTADPRLLARIHNDCARTLLELGERDRALELLDRAGSEFEQAAGGDSDPVEDNIFRAQLARNQGSVFHRQGRFDDALGIYSRALELIADGDEDRYKKTRAQILNSIGLSHMKAFRLEQSLEYFNPALELARSIGDLKTEAMVRINMGVVANDMGRADEALDLLTGEHSRLQALAGDTRELAALEFNIGESYMFMERFEEAVPWYRRALDVAERIRYREFEAAARYNLGEVLNTLGRADEAIRVLEPAEQMAEQGGWDLQRMDLANLLGEIYRERGEPDRARSYHEKALGIGRELGDEFGTGWALRNVALDILSAAEPGPDELDLCDRMLVESVELLGKAGQPENLMHSLRELIRFRLERRGVDTGVRELLDELKTLAAKTAGTQFGEFCEQVEKRLGG